MIYPYPMSSTVAGPSFWDALAEHVRLAYALQYTPEAAAAHVARNTVAWMRERPAFAPLVTEYDARKHG